MSDYSGSSDVASDGNYGKNRSELAQFDNEHHDDSLNASSDADEQLEEASSRGNSPEFLTDVSPVSSPNHDDLKVLENHNNAPKPNARSSKHQAVPPIPSYSPDRSMASDDDESFSDDDKEEFEDRGDGDYDEGAEFGYNSSKSVKDQQMPQPSPYNMAQSVVLSKVPRYAKLTVTEPQKISDGSSSYISYLVTSQVYEDERPDRVRRRFSEFSRLYDNLCAEFPACAIPPLPDRWRLEYIAGDRFSNEFTTKRAASLQRFLFCVSQHPDLRKSRYFKLFLSVGGAVINGHSAGAQSQNNGVSSQQALASSSRLLSPGPGPNKNGILDNDLGDARAANGESATMVALDHISDALMNAFAKAKHQSKDMIDARERADRYEQNINTIDKAVVRTAKGQAELATDFKEMNHYAKKLAMLDPDSASEFNALASTANVLASASNDLRLGVDSHFACALRDMSHYVQALKGMFKQREQRQIDYEALVEYQKRSEHELVAAEHGQPAPTFSSSFLRTKMNELRGVDKEQLRQQRISKLKTKISEFKKESAKAKDVSDAFEQLAKREVRVFDQTEAIELQQSLTGLSDSYIEYYSTVLKECRELEAKFGL